ncbi:F-box only protein 36-like [Acanthaster planci]|uniref:F-box only protein 36-like n=1 Tax=Acanthaster planci TaxID=133434 RepID=A0A8B7YUT5_ACAPL|nr:F-box only protein 36-like [Acanthaster planci]
MASFRPADGVWLDVSGQAPSPSKDFNQFIINTTEVIWRTWKITLRNDYRRLAPGEIKESHEDFTYDDRMQFDVGRVFGEATLEYAKEVCKGNIDFLVRMPRPLLIYMVSYLELEDIAALSQTCKLMYDICNTEALWEQIYETHCDTVTDEMRSLAHEMGWKRMFFTNKLQLQVKLRRHQQKRDSPDGGTTFLTDS